MAISGTPASRSSIGAALKPVFDKQARDILPNDFNFYKWIKGADGEKIKLDGEKFVIEVLYARNDRAQAFAELGDLPSSDVPKFAKAELAATRIAQPIQIGHEILMLADRDVATFTTKLEMLWDDARKALARTMNRQAVGNGTGIVATVGGAVTGGSATASVTVDDTSALEENAVYDIWNGAADTNVTLRNTAPVRFVVRSIDSATAITVAMSDGGNVPAGVTTNDVLIRAGSCYVDTTRKSYEMNGIQAITGTGSFMGLASSTARRWAATRFNASSTAIGPRLLGRAQIAMQRNSASSGKVTTIFTSPEQSLEVVYGSSSGTYAKVEYTRDDAAKASVKNPHRPSFNFDGREITVQTDLMLPVTKAFLANDEALLIGSLHDVKLEEFGDGMTALPVFNPTTGSYVPADISWLVWRGNMGCFARNEFCEVYGLPVPS